MIRIRMVGDFAVEGPGGHDLTPRGAKSRALLALLCRTPGRRRPRRWLEARLWSDRGQEQASGSLRQSLVEIRRALGNEAGILLADRDSVALGEVSTDLDDDTETARLHLAAGREFLEGLDIRDEAFEAWLREERGRIRADPALNMDGAERGGARDLPEARAAIPLLIRMGEVPSGLGGFVAVALADAIARMVTEFAAVDVFGQNGALARMDTMAGGLVLAVQAAPDDDRLHVMVALGTLGSSQILWSRQATLTLGETDALSGGTLPALTFQAAEAAQAALPRLAAASRVPDHAAEALLSQSVRDMFTFDADRLRRADRQIERALGLRETGRAHAWRGLLRQIMAIERTETELDRLRAEADEASRKALELDGANPLVLALVSQVRVMLDRDGEVGAVLARDAMALSPDNAFSHAAAAGAALQAGQTEAARQHAGRGGQIAGRTAIRHWWDSLSGLAALAGGDLEAAIAHYEAAHARAPSFRAALRHLVFLYLATGQREKADRARVRLCRLEPDFSLERVREDPAYPAATLRRMRLLGPASGEI
ncbi:MAG: hypothetical protein ACK4KW_06230 [Gemmobacter sp.]